MDESDGHLRDDHHFSIREETRDDASARKNLSIMEIIRPKEKLRVLEELCVLSALHFERRKLTVNTPPTFIRQTR